MASLWKVALVMVKHAQTFKIAAYVLLTVGLALSGIAFVKELNLAYEHAERIRKAKEDGIVLNQADSTPTRKRYATALVFVVACGAGLAILIGRDFSGWVGHRAGDLIFNEDRKGIHTPEYERAETEATAGNYLEAIRLMRIHYASHPNEVYVPLRIAEIYEVNLRNYVASALEYEEILRLPLPGDRWGWTAIHLVNLYNGKLNRADDAIALLNRIVDEHPTTAPARKARARLGIPEPETVVAPTAAEAEPEIDEEEIEDGVERFEQDNLPSGFRARTTRSAAGHGLRPASDMIEVLRDDEAPAQQPSLPPGFRPKS